MAEQVVLFEIRNNVGWVTLNRPTAMNSLTPGVLAGIDAALDISFAVFRSECHG